ncbi:hypothetical protein IAU60_003248 [Kwoniella sp. DSM 27419]
MSLVARFEHLPNRPGSDQARPLLEKIASQVKPIMTKRGWKVGTLAEFLPTNPALLGLNQNAGERINLRLRPPGMEHTFYEYDQLVLVMLHELTHNVHGPHDAKFYKLLGEIEEEYYDLKRKGYSGDGFHSDGNRLNGTKLSEYEGRARGLAAAEKRMARQKVIGRGGVLGGTRTEGKSMKDLVADAAERRMRDDKACKAGDDPDVLAEVRKAQQESVGIDASDIETRQEPLARADRPARSMDDNVIDLTEDDGPNASGNAPRPSRVQSTAIKKALSHGQLLSTSAASADSSSQVRVPYRKAARATDLPIPSPPQAINRTASETVAHDWSCPTCTLINPDTAKRCEACETPGPVTSDQSNSVPYQAPAVGSGLWVEEGWFCEFCGAGPRAKEFWSCAECGWVRKWG